MVSTIPWDEILNAVCKLTSSSFSQIVVPPPTLTSTTLTYHYVRCHCGGQHHHADGLIASHFTAHCWPPLLVPPSSSHWWSKLLPSEPKVLVVMRGNGQTIVEEANSNECLWSITLACAWSVSSSSAACSRKLKQNEFSLYFGMKSMLGAAFMVWIPRKSFWRIL